MNELLPCPFCGEKELRLYERREGYSVHCWNLSCGAKLEYAPTQEQAREDWNRRANPLLPLLREAREALGNCCSMSDRCCSKYRDFLTRLDDALRGERP